MDGFLGHALSVFMGFFAIMNPVANTPVFLGLTEEDDGGTRRKIPAKALIASFIIIFVFCAAGKLIFDLFGITLPDWSKPHAGTELQCCLKSYMTIIYNQ